MVIESIRSFFAAKLAPSPGEIGSDRLAIAACALLLEIGHADAFLGEEERARIVQAAREMGAKAEDLDEILRLADEERRESVDLYQFTRLLAESFSREQRLRLVEAIWGVVYSDGVLTQSENQLARRVAELLGFQHPEVQAARDRIARSR